MQGRRRNNLQNFTVYLDGRVRNLQPRQGRDRISGSRLAGSDMRRYRRVPILEGEVRQIHLRQNENNCEQRQFESEKQPTPVLHGIRYSLY